MFCGSDGNFSCFLPSDRAISGFPMVINKFFIIFITLSDDVNSKEMILDIKAILNDNYITNLEMQVINNHDWPERSLTYLCRCFDNLQKGVRYSLVKSAAHIGFLDYTLFPEYPEFFSTYQLINPNNVQLYTGKFVLNVVDLALTDEAISDDKIHHRELWEEEQS